MTDPTDLHCARCRRYCEADEDCQRRPEGWVCSRCVSDETRQGELFGDHMR